ncbi:MULTISPECIES: MATE family efflux transporter [unclassified Clostridioides]|uniref:MATE family efflux transporter n=1 Tax=unclassified Clostridioides TaxID=2635829 RepID=UPI001D1039BB|nr:MATE family efflux transporter [Clostridioides sp. ZZV14-6154]MCC0669687.1 MATE family efflux transporter [Clostridioides sp. ZZV14-6153]MCC0718887.1 MATE family efflux transporter [Clostridioides sp. ZZV14-6105]MCC0726977.1 MATE family efflux transporter [Clostridioides sp. ZZV14-6045]MCC0731671.1 MATE family efflux transporter [Clostridioides sp. ZZV14-6048]MCC0735915.1 MATE family efflux transporter [Clostridioides sp. ZZV14-6009]MCC0740132.1 MATE family efflux transporter [Clostridioid
MEQLNMLEEKPVLPLLMRMAIPPMISNLIMSMYNIVDSIFVAKIGQDAVTAVSLVYPIQNLILSIALGFGISLASCISRYLGAKQTLVANKIATHGIVFVGIHYIISILLGLFLINPFLSQFISDSTITQWGYDYAFIIILFSFSLLFEVAIENIFVATGKTALPMLTQGLGAITNIILDPILIFGLCGFPAMEVRGAAIATVIGQIAGMLLAVFILKYKIKEVRINFRGFRISSSVLKAIYSVSIPSTLMLAVPSIMVSILNGILATISQTAVATFGIFFKLQTFVYMPSYGLMQALRPVVGYNYGAKKWFRAEKAIKISIVIISCIMLFGMILFELIPAQILTLFNADAEMKSIGITALRVISPAFIISVISLLLFYKFKKQAITSIT